MLPFVSKDGCFWLEEGLICDQLVTETVRMNLPTIKSSDLDKILWHENWMRTVNAELEERVTRVMQTPYLIPTDTHTNNMHAALMISKRIRTDRHLRELSRLYLRAAELSKALSYAYLKESLN